MRIYQRPQFLTFVLSAVLLTTKPAYTKPSEPAPDLPLENSSQESVSPRDAERRESITVTPPPAGPTQSTQVAEREVFYNFRKAITLRAGLVNDSKASSPLNQLGALFLFPYRLMSFEAGADLHSDGSGSLHLARRFVFSRSAFRPYLKAGAGLRIVPEDQLVVILRHENYQLRGAAGFEYLVHSPQSLRLELEGALSERSLQGSINLGYVWAW